jgi:cAMP-dependent protein kinase regulator
MDYRENMYFGELALLDDSTRRATLVTKSRCELASIDKKSFRAILGPLQEIMKRHSESYVTFPDPTNP